MSEDRKRNIAAVFLAGAVLIPWLINIAKAKPEVEQQPIPLDTNELKSARLYKPHGSNEFLFKVVDIDPAQLLPDGEVRMGIKVRNSGSVWVPRENMNKMLVGQ